MNISESLRSKPLENPEDYNILQLLELCHHSSTSSNIHISQCCKACVLAIYIYIVQDVGIGNLWHWHHAITSRWSKTRDWSCLAMGGMSKSVKSGWTFNGSWISTAPLICLEPLNWKLVVWFACLFTRDAVFLVFRPLNVSFFQHVSFLWLYGIRCRRY